MGQRTKARPLPLGMNDWREGKGRDGHGGEGKKAEG